MYFTRSLVLCVCFVGRCLSFCPFFLPLRSMSFDLRILTLLAVQQNHVAMGALVVQQNLVEMGVLVVHQNLVQMGCIGRSTKFFSNGLHWSFNKILFKWVALVVQQLCSYGLHWSLNTILFKWLALVVHQNFVQKGCIGRLTKSCSNGLHWSFNKLCSYGLHWSSTQSCSNGLHWSFNKILFKWVALVVQQNLVEIVV